MQAICFLLVLLFCFYSDPPCSAGQSQDPVTLVYFTEEYAPYNYTDKGKLKGLSVNTLKLMWQEMGIPEQPIKVMPWARAYSKVQTDPKVVLFSAMRTAERESNFKWVGPIAKGRISLFALKQKDFPITEFNDLSKYRIGTIRNLPPTPQLDKQAFDIVINTHTESGVKMLDSGRIDFLAMDDYAFFSTTKKMGYPADRFKKIWILSKGDLYIIFNKKTPDTLITRFQNALDSVQKKPAYRNMVNHYLD